MTGTNGTSSSFFLLNGGIGGEDKTDNPAFQWVNITGIQCVRDCRIISDRSVCHAIEVSTIATYHRCWVVRRGGLAKPVEGWGELTCKGVGGGVCRECV